MYDDIKFVLFYLGALSFSSNDYCFYCEFFVSNGIYKLDLHGLPVERNAPFLYGHVCSQK